jgi:hypothetical protein
MGANATHDEYGRPYVHSTSQPWDTESKFYGCGEDGTPLIVNMLNSDESATVEISFDKVIHVAYGQVFFTGAPLGSTISINLVYGENSTFAGTVN